MKEKIIEAQKKWSEGIIKMGELSDNRSSLENFTTNFLDEMYDFYDDIDRSSSFAFYINSFVEQYDPHTIYYDPEAKDRFDVDMSGNYAGIGARLTKKSLSLKLVETFLRTSFEGGRHLDRINMIEL